MQNNAATCRLHETINFLAFGWGQLFARRAFVRGIEALSCQKMMKKGVATLCRKNVFCHKKINSHFRQKIDCFLHKFIDLTNSLKVVISITNTTNVPRMNATIIVFLLLPHPSIHLSTECSNNDEKLSSSFLLFTWNESPQLNDGGPKWVWFMRGRLKLNCCSDFWAILGIIWATFYFTIWSHCVQSTGVPIWPWCLGRISRYWLSTGFVSGH